MFIGLFLGVMFLLDGAILLFLAAKRRKMLAAAETESTFEQRFATMHGDRKVKIFQWLGFFVLAVGMALISISLTGGFGEWEAPE